MMQDAKAIESQFMIGRRESFFWNLVDGGATHEEAAAKVKSKFLNELCGEDKNTHFFCWYDA